MRDRNDENKMASFFQLCTLFSLPFDHQVSTMVFMKRTRLTIYEYTDFRRFIADRLTELHVERSQYSRRYICRKLGLASNNYLKLIIEGQRRLTDSLAPKLAEILGLSDRETEFFLDLVGYNQARTTTAKNKALNDLRLHRRFVQVHQLAIDAFDYFADPITVAMRELVALEDFQEDPDWISARLRQPATPRQIRAAITKLERLGLLARDPNGRLHAVDAHQDSGAQLGSAPLRTYHVNMLRLAGEAMELPPTTRYYQGLTVSIPGSAYERIVAQVQKAVEEVRSIVDEARPCEHVYHLELAFFPLTKRREGER